LKYRNINRDSLCATEENERFQREVEILTGDVEVPGANDFRTKNILETSYIGGGDGGIVDHSGRVDNILHSTELCVDIAQSKFQGREIANVDLAIRAMASCARRKARKFLNDLTSEFI
jgi:hypothetical protein